MKGKRTEAEERRRDLQKELLDLRKAQFSLRMQVATQQLTNTSQLGKVRKDIARDQDPTAREGGGEMSEGNPACAAPCRGAIVSDKMNKTVTVLVERRVKHPVIGKVMTRSRKYHAHVEGLEARDGDLVQIEECAPISKTKAWRVAQGARKGAHRLILRSLFFSKQVDNTRDGYVESRLFAPPEGISLSTRRSSP
jgi:small subunit ribosomal protein S17